MASAKEYEISFLLNAKENSGFSSTFKKAQAEFTRLGGEIQSLQKIQSDISSYQKQQSAIETTEKRLANLTQQQALLKQEIAEAQAAGQSTAGLEREEKQLEERIRLTNSALEDKNSKLKATSERLEAAGVDTANLAEKDAELTSQIAELKEEQQKAADAADSFGSRAADAFSAVQAAIAAAGIATALHEIYEAYTECITVAAGFEQSLSNVEALSGASSAEMAQLSDLAKELGASTVFTAKQSADAMGYMAMAGWSVNDMLSGMDGVLSLAAASGEDLAMVADIVTDSMTGFGLTAADTSRYADVLAAAAANANTNVSLMGETFKYAAPLAGALGYDVEDVAVATGLMANAGIKGSEAGSTLRNIFTRLAKPTKESTDAMNALGISLTDGAGKMYTWMQVMEQMREGFAGLTEEEQAFYAAELAGQRGMSGLLAIVNAGEDDFASLSAAITNSTGAAQRMADVKLDNLNGQIALLESAAEGLQITVGEQLTPTLADLAGTGAGILGDVNAFLQANPGVIKGVTAFVGVIGLAAGGVAAVTVAVNLFNAAAAAIPGVGIIMAITAAVAGVAALTVAIREANDPMKKLTATARQQERELEALNAEYQKFVDAGEETSDEALRLRYQIDELTESYDANKRTLGDLIAEADALIEASDAIKDEYRATAEAVQDDYLKTLSLITAYRDAADAAGDGGAAAQELSYMLDKLGGALPGVAEELIANGASAEEVAAAYQKAAEEAYNYSMLQNAINTKVELSAQTSGYEEALATLRADRLALLNEYGGTHGYTWDEEINAYRNETTGATYSYSADDLEAYISGLSEVNAQIAEQEAALADNEAQIAACEEAAEKYSEAIAEAAETDFSGMDYALADVKTQLDALAESYGEVYDAAYKSVSGQYAIWDDVADVAMTKTTDITSSLEKQADYWASYNDNLEKLSARTGDIEGLSDVIASFADGSADSVNAIAGMADATDDDLKAMVENYQKVKEAQEKVSESIAILATDFDQKMDEIAQSLQETVEDMEFSDEASRAARDSIQAFIDEASNADTLARVQNAYDAIGRAAARGLSSATGTITTVTTNADRAYANAGSPSLRGSGGREVGYAATGTDNAPPGWTWVGEEGPELLRFAGGEQVIPAAQSIELYREYARYLEAARQIQSERNSENRIVSEMSSISDVSNISDLSNVFNSAGVSDLSNIFNAVNALEVENISNTANASERSSSLNASNALELSNTEYARYMDAVRQIQSERNVEDSVVSELVNRLNATNILEQSNIANMTATPEIRWFAEGGILTGATIFGGGEAGKEAVLPLSTLWPEMQTVVGGALNQYASNATNTYASTISTDDLSIQNIVNELAEIGATDVMEVLTRQIETGASGGVIANLLGTVAQGNNYNSTLAEYLGNSSVVDTHNRYAQAYTDIYQATAPQQTEEAEKKPPPEALPDPWAGKSTSGGSIPPITLEMHFHFDGNVSPETVQAAQEFGDDIGERVRAAVEDALETARLEAGRRGF